MSPSHRDTSTPLTHSTTGHSATLTRMPRQPPTTTCVARSRTRPWIAAVLALGVMAPVVHASDGLRLSLEGGRSYMDSYGTNTAFVELLGGEHDFGHSSFHWTPVVSLGWIDGRNLQSYADSKPGTRHATELLGGGVRVSVGAPQDWYRSLFFCAQLAYNHQTTLALSTHYQFISALGWQGQRFSFMIRHISNGGLHLPNRGETMALVGVTFDL